MILTLSLDSFRVTGTVVVSTTTSGCTIISCEEYCVGSSVMVLSDMSDGIRGYICRLTERTGLSRGRGDGSGVGASIMSPLSLGII